MRRKKKYSALVALLIIIGIGLMVVGGLQLYQEIGRQDNGISLDAFQDEIEIKDVTDPSAVIETPEVEIDSVTESQNVETTVSSESAEAKSVTEAVTNVTEEGADGNE